jgi:hypothetical protein
VAGQERGDLTVPPAVADEGLAEAGPAAGDMGSDPRGDGVPGLLVRCLRHAVHDGRRAVAACRALLAADGNGAPLMLPDAVLLAPASLMTLLPVFSPSFRAFTMLVCGFLAQSGKRTVCGMLAGAGLSRLWPHDRALFLLPCPLEPR